MESFIVSSNNYFHKLDAKTVTDATQVTEIYVIIYFNRLVHGFFNYVRYK